MVLEKYAGDIPNSVQGLMEIPGVGEIDDNDDDDGEVALDKGRWSWLLS